MDDKEFIERIKEKIQKLAGKEVELVLDNSGEKQVSVDFSSSVPRVVMPALVLHTPGLARMSIEFAVACLRRGHEISPLEFYAILRRN